MRKKAETQLHFVGIGGIGMSGIAEVFLNQGYRVSGSDLSESDSTRRLSGLGAKISIGHHATHIQGADVVVISSAVRANNPEVVAAKAQRIPVIPRAEMLGELMRGKTGIAVAGTHGKTTTTSMLASILTHAGLDPTLVIGGKVDALGGNAKLGQGQYVVAEADESDGSFLQLPATYGIVTNIDNDHLDHFGNLASIDDAFTAFVGKLPFYGTAAVCLDDPGIKRCLGRFTKPFFTYGFSSDADYFATDVSTSGLTSTYTLNCRASQAPLGPIKLQVPGRHNILNSLATITIALQIEVPFSEIAAGLAGFSGAGRRFDIRWRNDRRKILLVDDYGHHPTEVAATLSAARAVWGQGRIVTIFQPHRYSRTLHCREAFMTAFRESDLVLMTDIYAAGEEPIDGVDSESLSAAINEHFAPTKRIRHVGNLAAALAALLQEVREGDLVLCLGAGSITKLAQQVATELETRFP